MNFIYVDGSFCNITGEAGIGIPQKNLSLKVKAKTSLAAELIAVLKGVQISKEYGIVCTDCMLIVKAIKYRFIVKHHEELCVNLFRLLSSKKNIKVIWVSRYHPSLKKADKLARLARSK